MDLLKEHHTSLDYRADLRMVLSVVVVISEKLDVVAVQDPLNQIQNSLMRKILRNTAETGNDEKSHWKRENIRYGISG